MMGLKKIKKLILHIGSEKTGTTSIQSMLSLNRELLESKSIRIPMFLGKPNHRYAEYAFRSNETQDDFDKNRGIFNDSEAKTTLKSSIKRDWEDTISRESLNTWLISCEHFQSRLHYQHEIRDLWQFTQQLFENTTIVIYLRDPLSTAFSHLSTTIKGGSIPRSFHINPETVSGICNHQKVLERWLSVVPKECLKVRLFDQSKFFDNDLYSDFFDACGLAIPPKLVIPPKANHSLSLPALRLMILLNQRIPAFINHQSNPARKDIIRYLEQYAGNAPSLVPPQEIQKEFKRYYQQSDDYIRANFFPHLEGELWPTPKTLEGSSQDFSSEIIYTEEEQDFANLLSSVWVNKQRTINRLRSELNNPQR